MGGKNKQRTKNNVRPSSSGRSAELLSSARLELVAGAASGGGGGAPLPVLFPSLAGAGATFALDPALTPEFALCFKKLNKKDPITKTKALVELTELVGRSPADDVVGALPSWARCYRALAVDTDRRVREATQGCHGAVSAACGRRAAPCLRQLVPVWLCSQYDDHAPAQSKAQHSLASTFPESKLPEVLSFCREEVLAHLRDNLVGSAEQNAVKKLESAEDSAAAGARRAASSLQGLQYVLERLPGAAGGDGDVWLRDQLAPLLRAPPFWKLAAHVDPVVRAAWYTSLGCLAARLGASLFDAQLGQKALRLLVGAREPAAPPAAALWGCLLQFMHHLPDWYQWLDNTDLLRKRILDVLETGGWGDARRLADLLLPLLASLPPDLRTQHFYEAFFIAAFAGLEKKSVVSSKSERQAWVSSVAECLRYVSVQRAEHTVEVVTATHRRWLEAALAARADTAGQLRAHLVRQGAAAMALLLKYWLRQAAAQPQAHFDQLVRNFWQNVASTMLMQIDNAPVDPEQVTSLMDGHILLLKTLKTAFLQENRKLHSIKFDGDAVEAPGGPPAPQPAPPQPAPPQPAPPCEPALVQRYMHNLDEVVQQVCARYFQLARERECSAVVTPLIGVLREFDTRQLLNAIAKQTKAGSLLGLYERVVRGWLVVTGDSLDVMTCEAAVDLVFLIMEYLTEEEKDVVFESFESFQVETVTWCLHVCLSHPARGWAAARRWARGGAAGAVLGAVVRRAAEHHPARDLLMLCLAHEDDGDMLISEATLSAIVSTVSSNVAELHAPSIEQTASLAAQLASTLAAAGSAGAVGGAYADLLLNLFRLNLMIYRGDGAVSPETWWEVRASWQDGLAALAGAARGCALRRAAELLRHRLLDSMDKLDLVKIDHIASLCPYLLQQCEESRPPQTGEVVELTRLLLDLRPPTPEGGPPGGPSVQLCALRHDCIASNLNCPFDDDNEDIKEIVRQSSDDVEELSKETLMLHVYELVFRASYLRTMLMWGAGEEELEGEGRLDRDGGQEGRMESKSQGELERETQRKLEEETQGGLEGETQGELEEKTQGELEEETQGELEEKTQGELEEKTQGELEEETQGELEEETQGELEEETQGELEEETQGELEEETQEEKKHGWCNALLEDESIVQEFNKLLHDYCVLCALHEGYAFWPHYDVVQQTKRKLDSILEDVMHETGGRSQRLVLGALSGLAAGEGYYWACARAYCLTWGAGEEGGGVESGGEEWGEGGAELQEVLTGNGYFHSLQADLKRRPDPERALQAAYLVMVRSLYCAHAHEPAVTDAQFAHDALAGREECSLDVAVNLYYRHRHVMLYDTDVRAASWRQVVSNAAVAECAARVVAVRGWELADHHWDFVTIALCSLLASIERSKDGWHTTKVSLLIRSVLSLYVSVSQFVGGVRGECVRRQPTAHVAALPAEWRDVFAPDAHHHVLSIAAHVLDVEHTWSMSAPRTAAVGALSAAAPHLEWPALSVERRAGRLSLARLVQVASSTLARPAHHGYKYLAHAVLGAITRPLVIEDAEKLRSWSESCLDEDEEEGARARPLFALAYFEPELVRLQDIVDAALAGFRAGEDTCEMEPFSDSHSVSLGYLLLCDALYAMYGLQQTDLMHHYIELFREPKYSESLLTASLRLLPAAVCAAALDTAGGGGPTSPTKQHHQDMFLATKEFSVYEASTSACVGALACRGVWLAVGAWGRAAARSWGGAAPARAGLALRRLVRAHVAPSLVKEQLQKVHEQAHTLEDTEITVHWSAGEVLCVYTVEDRPLELCVSLGREYPLAAPAVVAPQAHLAAAVRNTQWLALYLTYQNGSVLHALRMWQGAVSARVESAPQCYICYCRMHPATGRLPTVPCHQCNNKFHNDCLRKWFTTSNKSNCPLCRAIF